MKRQCDKDKKQHGGTFGGDSAIGGGWQGTSPDPGHQPHNSYHQYMHDGTALPNHPIKSKGTKPRQSYQHPVQSYRSKHQPQIHPPHHKPTHEFHEYFQYGPGMRAPAPFTLHSKLSDSGESLNSFVSGKSNSNSAQSEGYKGVAGHNKQKIPLNLGHTKYTGSGGWKKPEKFLTDSYKSDKEKTGSSATSQKMESWRSPGEKMEKSSSEGQFRMENWKWRQKQMEEKVEKALVHSEELSKKNEKVKKSISSVSVCKKSSGKSSKGLTSLSVLKKKQNLLMKNKPEELKNVKITDSISLGKDNTEQLETNPEPPSPKTNLKTSPQLSPKSQKLPKQLVLLKMGGYCTLNLTIIKKLAEHSATSTYVCFHSATHSIYCLKQCKVNQDTIGQLIVESKVGLVHNCKHLIRMYGIGYDKWGLYLLMEYMQGGTLREKLMENGSTISVQHLDLSVRSRIDTSKSPPSNHHKLHQCKQLAQQLLMALEYLHGHNIVHRDVKPENIFITHHSTYKLGDFGSSTYTLSQEHVGTLDYAAPEILHKTPYNESVDMWSVGCVLFEYVVGRPPFYHRDRHQTVKRILAAQYSPQEIENPSLRDLLTKLLHKDAQSRLTASQALNHPFLTNRFNQRTRY